MNLSLELLKTAPEKARQVLESVVMAQARFDLFSLPGPDEPAATIVVGLSGGADSVCLLHALNQLASQWRLALHVAHVDHRLRDASAEDAAFAQCMADELGLPFHLHTLSAAELRADPDGIEAAARDARYAFLQQCASEQAAAGSDRAYVAVAHHTDDQAETVLMNMIRGSGLRGLGGMPWSRPFIATEQLQSCQVSLVRPLLGTSKAAILDYVDAYQLTYRDDETNSDTAFLRNRIRHETLPQLAQLNPHIVETLARTAELCRAEAERTELVDERMLSGLTYSEQTGTSIALRLDMLLEMPLAPQRGVLQHACKRLGIETRELGFDSIEQLLATVTRSQDASGPHTLMDDLDWTLLAESSLNPMLLAIHRHGALPYEPDFPQFSQPQNELRMTLDCTGEGVCADDWTLQCDHRSVTELPSDWRSGRHPWRAYLDGALVQQLVLTTAQPGMIISPLGMDGSSKSVGDIFTDRKIAPAFRSGWPVVVNSESDEVLWLCGICLSEKVKVTDDTEQVLALTWTKNLS